jgi:hypothetical protein
VRKAKWVVIGAAALVVLMFIGAALRARPRDDYADLAPYAPIDKTVYYSQSETRKWAIDHGFAGSIPKGDVAQRSLFVKSIPRDVLSHLMQRLAKKRGWTYSGGTGFCMATPAGSGKVSSFMEPGILVQELQKRPLKKGPNELISIYIQDTTEPTPWDVLKARLAHFGRLPYDKLSP